MLKKLFIVAVIFAIIGGGFLFWANSLYNAAGSYTEPKHVVIAKGSGVSGILKQLEKEGVISNPLVIRIYAKLTGVSYLKYGEYIFEPGLSPAEVLAKLGAGDVVERKITIPEGKTVYEI